MRRASSTTTMDPRSGIGQKAISRVPTRTTSLPVAALTQARVTSFEAREECAIRILGESPRVCPLPDVKCSASPWAIVSTSATDGATTITEPFGRRSMWWAIIDVCGAEDATDVTSNAPPFRRSGGVRADRGTFGGVVRDRITDRGAT